jgi:hypothetical protein
LEGKPQDGGPSCARVAWSTETQRDRWMALNPGKKFK